MNIASLSLCYPSPTTPNAGVFVERRLAALADVASVYVFNPVPAPVWSRRSRTTTSDGPPSVTHVPMPYIPGLSLPVNPQLYAHAVMRVIREAHNPNRFDLIDAHFSFPDAVAAATIARTLNIPYTVTLRGLLAKYTRSLLTRRSVLNALHNAAAIITVSDDLRTQAIRLGIPEERMTVVPNGIDTSVFHPSDRSSARSEFGRHADDVILLTVGHLCPRKGVHRVLEILPDLITRHPRLQYVVVGDDAAEPAFRRQLQQRVADSGLQSRVTFTGHLPPVDIARWMSAADLFVLPTINEGWCNVLHEAVACRIPVVTTDVGGNREIVGTDQGTIIPPDDPSALAAAITKQLARPAQTPISALASRSWANVASEVLAVFDTVRARQPLPTALHSTAH